MFRLATTALEQWLDEADTDLDLADSIVEYVQQRGTTTMEEVVREAPCRFWTMGLSQDRIGWRRSLEGMILKEITVIQRQFYALNGSRLSLEKWSSRLITRLMEITHGQWLYRNYIVHDLASGTIATARKENLLLEIELQCELGDAGLLEENKYLAKVNLEEMESSLGNGNIIGYWLYRPRGMLKYYGSKGSPNQQLEVTPQESRAGKYQLSASQRGQRCFLYSICDLFLQIFLSYCLGLPHAHKMHEEESSLHFCGFTATLFGSMPSAYEDSGKVKLV